MLIRTETIGNRLRNNFFNAYFGYKLNKFGRRIFKTRLTGPVDFHPNNKLCTFSHAGKKIYFSQEHRKNRYEFGIESCLIYIARTYHLYNIPWEKDDIVIDCGANIGEVGMWLQRHGIKYHAFEPELLEAACCDLNNFGGKEQTNRKGLWHESGTLTLYSSPAGADSSLFEFEGYAQTHKIPVLSLDDYASQNKLEKIKLLKLEAEGAEPEVLDGAKNSLPKIAYIAADCGPERGMAKETTLPMILERLESYNFAIMAERKTKGRHSVLLKNLDF